MRRIVINSKKHGKYIIKIDNDDYDLVMKHTWSLAFKGTRNLPVYAYTTFRKNNIRHSLLLHRLIMQPSKGEEVDHIDHDGLNNQRNNLRITSHQQNMCNKILQINNTSCFKGVSYNKHAHKFECHFKLNGKKMYGGLFVVALDAAKKYNELAIKYYGRFALLNQIP